MDIYTLYNLIYSCCCVDAFSVLISKAAQEKKISGAKYTATLQECSKIADIISIYERALSQKVNLSKTEVAFSKCVSVERRSAIIETLGVREVERHEKYLGLPTIIGKSKKSYFCLLERKNMEELNGWKERLMSKSGKEVLIKVVAQAIPTYMLSVFKIPEGLIDEIHTLLCRFWWGSREGEKRLHWQVGKSSVHLRNWVA
ncbi:uncharacterized protein LOC110695850 [Chenopodium quinoa]|uniref:uncharacterized protein LOC110695850 n=1 Tax=Chenopodium quinoa TaxID=63459 RepID=UPI000B78AF0A|nr:uncharacterized protein LOC110695850 [Chenopodium quinoa]